MGTGANAEEDVLCLSADIYPNMDITVHEFAHSLHKVGFNNIWPSFQTELDALYLKFRNNWLWGNGYVGSYAMQLDASKGECNCADEYFANAIQTYFNAQNSNDQVAPVTRNQLSTKD